MPSTKKQIKKVLIVGGGSAGWMTANILAFVWQKEAVEVCLIESSEIEAIGVGEGSTPALKGFFDHLGIAESTWMPLCNATYKCGIDFRGWSGNPSFPRYFHPFPTSFDKQISPTFFSDVERYRRGEGAIVQPDDYYISAYLAKRGLSPISSTLTEKAITYGYHFDARLLGKFLAENARKLGVKHITGTVGDVALDGDGYIKSICLDGGGLHSADFFVDCTGFRGLLAGGAMSVPWKSYANMLFNDAAVTIATPAEDNLCPETVATALSNGWAWRIPLTTRVGNGYVYASKYCSAAQAEAELRTHLDVTGDEVPARHIKMKVGRLESPWFRNCLAVGLAQGFVEPLEATSLLVAQQTASIFANNLRRNGFYAVGAEQFNKHINELFDGICDYIVAHYKTNTIGASDYWRDAREMSDALPDNLRAVLSSWHAGNLRNAVESRRLERFYSLASWYCLLAGVGVFNNDRQKQQSSSRPEHVEAIAQRFHKLGESFLPHMSQLRLLSHKT